MARHDSPGLVNARATLFKVGVRYTLAMARLLASLISWLRWGRHFSRRVLCCNLVVHVCWSDPGKPQQSTWTTASKYSTLYTLTLSVSPSLLLKPPIAPMQASKAMRSDGRCRLRSNDEIGSVEAAMGLLESSLCLADVTNMQMSLLSVMTMAVEGPPSLSHRHQEAV